MSPKTKTIILEILYFPFRVLLLCWLAITWIILFLDMILPTVKGSKAERDPYNEGRSELLPAALGLKNGDCTTDGDSSNARILNCSWIESSCFMQQ